MPIKNRNISLLNSNGTIQQSELISNDILRNQLNSLEVPPRPFGNVLKGLHPTSFVTTPKSDVFPQLNSYRSPGYPRNIQEIIGYLSKNQLHTEDSEIEDSSNRYPKYYKTENSNKPHSIFHQTITQDPFNVHKPQDPSDINLLATGNVRFAPPVWTNFIKSSPQIIEQMATQYQEIVRGKPKVTNLILNVFPIGTEYRVIAQLPGKSRNVPRNPYLEELHKRNIHPQRFVLYINLYDAELNNLDEPLESSS